MVCAELDAQGREFLVTREWERQDVLVVPWDPGGRGADAPIQWAAQGRPQHDFLFHYGFR